MKAEQTIPEAAHGAVPTVRGHREVLTGANRVLLHDLFDRAARLGPDVVAVDIPPGRDRPRRVTVTYETLRLASEAIAASLAPMIAGECVVAILASRTSEALFAAQLGVLKAGAAHTSLDIAFPEDQIRATLRESGAVALLVDERGWERARAGVFGGTTLVRIADLVASSAAAPSPPAWLSGRSLAYIIYTSGTSGKPKGVMIEHASIVNLVESDVAEFQLHAGDRVAQGSSCAYDSAIEETWLAFASGATLVVMDDAAARMGPDLVAWLQREQVSVLCPPPTLLRTLGCNDPATALPSFRLLYVGGEPLPQAIADRWAPGRRMENGYGPTEVTVTSVRTRITAGEPVAIGKPVPGLAAYVLDDDMQIVPDGEQGELCLGGVGLARGYQNDSALTAAKFPEHPSLGRIYRTGDLVHRAPDGRLFSHGRLDAQVKLRGYRIELEAIEARLAGDPEVRDAACTIQGAGPDATLVGFVVARNPATPPSLDTLMASLRTVLPAYMVPSRLALLDAIPRTVGGKVHRQALPRIDLPVPSHRAGAKAARS